MTSKALTRNTFLDPEEHVHQVTRLDESKVKKVNVYEAVAGKINGQGFIPKQRVYASTRDTASSSTTAIPPQDVLYRRLNAPSRYAESDVYFANEKRDDLDLPDSELLKAVHVYTSDFYSHAVKYSGADFSSMDETALLAFGILLDETTKEVLGRTGDLVFTEGEDVANDQALAVAEVHEDLQPKRKKRRLHE